MADPVRRKSLAQHYVNDITLCSCPFIHPCMIRPLLKVKTMSKVTLLINKSHTVTINDTIHIVSRRMRNLSLTQVRKTNYSIQRDTMLTQSRYAWPALCPICIFRNANKISTHQHEHLAYTMCVQTQLVVTRATRSQAVARIADYIAS